MPWTDEELVARSISGDTESFNELILRWERPIYALAYRTIGREEDARDVCQETSSRIRALPAAGRRNSRRGVWDRAEPCRD
jgi:RNA polymerase sigma-70 factor (ECF subfamily)